MSVATSEIHALCQFRKISIWPHDPSEWFRLTKGREKGLGLAVTSMGPEQAKSSWTSKQACRKAVPKAMQRWIPGAGCAWVSLSAYPVKSPRKGWWAGSRIGEGEGRVSVPKPGCFLSLWFLSHWSSQPPFPDSVHSLYTLRTPNADRVSNVPRPDWSLSSSRLLKASPSHRISETLCPSGPWALILLPLRPGGHHWTFSSEACIQSYQGPSVEWQILSLSMEWDHR